MSDVLLAVFFVAIIAIGAIKISNGDLSDAWGRIASSRTPAGPETRPTQPPPGGITTAATAGSAGTLDVWLDARVKEFGTMCATLAASHLGVTRSQLHVLYEKRGEVLGQLYGRMRFMANDDEELEAAERTIKGVDDFFTGWIARLKKESADVRGITWPLSNGDGDARMTHHSTPPPALMSPPATMRV